MSDHVIVCNLEYAVRHLPDLSSKAGFKLEKTFLALIKPNICGIYHPSLDLLSSIVGFLLSGAKSVVIGETSSMMHDPKEQFESLGVNALVKRFGGSVRAVDLCEDERVKVRVSSPHALKEIDFPKTVLDSDVLVNVPRIGTHSTTRLTCAIKNLLGLLPQKRKFSVYHPLGVDKVIADIASVIRPDLNVVDAGSKVILGVDVLAVDVVACRFVDVDPMKVEHLRLVSEDRDEKLESLMKRVKVIDV